MQKKIATRYQIQVKSIIKLEKERCNNNEEDIISYDYKSIRPRKS